ncbi:MAG: phosphoribosylformylglycinamidine synthase subunit PurS [Synergistes sp.]|nr:phosphoribosylformylglycinamidine synthase subunit PurS [Synergistes sp.]
MLFHAEALITPREGVLDTQGKAVEKTLINLGYESVSEVRVGRIVTLRLEAADGEAAAEAVKEMCQDLLANELIETYTISIREA